MKFKKIPGGMMAQRVDSSPAGTTENVAVANGGQESNVDAGTPNGGQDSNGETCTPNGGQTVPSTEVVPSGNAVVELGSTNDGIVGPVLGSRGPGRNGGRGSNVQVQSEQSIPFNSSVWQGRGNGRGNHPFHNGQQRGKNRAERNSNRGRGRGAPFQTKEYYSSAFASFTSSAVGYIDATSGNSTSFSGGDRFSHALIANGKHHAHQGNGMSSGDAPQGNQCLLGNVSDVIFRNAGVAGRADVGLRNSTSLSAGDRFRQTLTANGYRGRRQGNSRPNRGGHQRGQRACVSAPDSVMNVGFGNGRAWTGPDRNKQSAGPWTGVETLAERIGALKVIDSTEHLRAVNRENPSAVGEAAHENAEYKFGHCPQMYQPTFDGICAPVAKVDEVPAAASKGSQPASRGSQPASRESQPVSRGSQPVSRGSQPVSRGSQPVSRGSQAVSRGSQAVSRGSQAPSRGSAAVLGGSHAASRGSQTASRGSQVASRESQTASRGSQAPSRGSQAPSRGSQAPSRGSQAPSRGSQAPSRGSQAPSRGSQAPSRGSQAPSRGSQAPSRGSQAPSRGSQAASRGSKRNLIDKPEQGDSAVTLEPGQPNVLPNVATVEVAAMGDGVRQSGSSSSVTSRKNRKGSNVSLRHPASVKDGDRVLQIYEYFQHPELTKALHRINTELELNYLAPHHGVVADPSEGKFTRFNGAVHATCPACKRHVSRQFLQSHRELFCGKTDLSLPDIAPHSFVFLLSEGMVKICQYKAFDDYLKRERDLVASRNHAGADANGCVCGDCKRQLDHSSTLAGAHDILGCVKRPQVTELTSAQVMALTLADLIDLGLLIPAEPAVVKSKKKSVTRFRPPSGHGPGSNGGRGFGPGYPDDNFPGGNRKPPATYFVPGRGPVNDIGPVDHDMPFLLVIATPVHPPSPLTTDDEDSVGKTDDGGRRELPFAEIRNDTHLPTRRRRRQFDDDGQPTSSGRATPPASSGRATPPASSGRATPPDRRPAE